ncbi:MAG TPA: thioesterase family protein [Marmoricola sp.]|nr:thioesterase family protein [Nocardioidaceae bacterium]MCB8993048.1 thioesterase family protein [Nocardioidaceae bacterium]MCO5323537.1 thioesterase family protein [Nocardioidaceae bacterium]HMU35593.1 thioesterase family protein [Marmoricola sp.]HRV67967.1 thioesterase family protein [Marmoricola sp.]
MLSAGLQASLSFTVTESDTALAVGSGSLSVLGTPRLIAWMEAATCAAIAEQLDDGQTSVGTRVEIQHLAPSRVGAKIEVVASTSHVDGKLVRFSASAKQDGKLIGSGEITRVVVESERFMARLA